MSVMFARRLLLPALLVAALVVPTCARADATESSIVRAMNAVRSANGLPRLHSSRGLQRAADAQSAHMLRTRTISHGAFSRRVRRYVHSRSVGENLAWMSRCNASQVVQMWLNSAQHRQIMLSGAFRRVGVGRRSGAGLCVVTADFASAH